MKKGIIKWTSYVVISLLFNFIAFLIAGKSDFKTETYYWCGFLTYCVFDILYTIFHKGGK